MGFQNLFLHLKMLIKIKIFKNPELKLLVKVYLLLKLRIIQMPKMESGVMMNIRNFLKDLLSLVKDGVKSKILLELEVVLKLDLMLRNFSNGCRSKDNFIIRNLRLAKTTMIQINYLNAKLHKIIYYKVSKIACKRTLRAILLTSVTT